MVTLEIQERGNIIQLMSLDERFPDNPNIVI